MKTTQIFKTQAGHDCIQNWYRKFMDALPYSAEERSIQTQFGKTQIVLTGGNSKQSDSIPLIVLHGAMSGAPFALGELCDLPSRHPMVAINIHGQSPVADPLRLNFKTNEYAQWVGEILDQLNIDQAIVAGVSWGGSVALNVAKHLAQRVAGMILVVPGSIVAGSHWRGFIDVGLPMMRFKLWPTESNRDRALRKLFTSHDPLWTPYLGDAITHYRSDMSVPPLVSESDLKEFNAPTYIIAADQDVCFPGARLLNRAQQIFPNLVGTHLLKDTNHSPSFAAEDRRRFTNIFESAIGLIESDPSNCQ